MNTGLNIKQSKPHYMILDGLRGVAALVVVMFHVFEIHSNGNHAEQIINHGYLAVDFFFFLSGFVIGYAYDDRWGQMTLADFFKRRIIRLQPMIVVGSVLGALLFYFQDSALLGWNMGEVPVWKLLLVMLIGATLFPVGKGLDIRGWNEMHPLNGPAWSLFFEYIANILYALIIRRLSKIALGALVIVAACITVNYALTNPNGDIIGGWSIDNLKQLELGFIRLAFPFLAGLLMARINKLKYVKNAFLWASILLVAVLAFPRIGDSETLWMNGLYECFCLFVVFPFVIWLGAGGTVNGKKANKVCRFLGHISYPIYITHYPLMYIYMAWVVNHHYTLAQSWPIGILTVAASVLLAYLLMKFYDLPLRRYLREKFL